MRRAVVTQPVAPGVSCLGTRLGRPPIFAPPAMRLMTLFIAGLPLACGEPLSPRDVAGAYALQRVAGNSLPTILYANGYVVVRVFAETLSFTPDGRGEDVTVQQNETVTGGLVTGPERSETAFGFRVVLPPLRWNASGPGVNTRSKLPAARGDLRPVWPKRVIAFVSLCARRDSNPRPSAPEATPAGDHQRWPLSFQALTRVARRPAPASDGRVVTAVVTTRRFLSRTAVATALCVD